MIPYTLTKDGKEETRQARTGWAGVTLGQYVDIMTEPSPLASACKLCGLSEEEYRRGGGVLDGLIDFALELVATGPQHLTRPDWLPADLGTASIGKFELCKKYLQMAAQETQAFPYLYAAYAYEYDMLQALVQDFPVPLWEKAAALPCMEALGACAHILSELVRLTEKHASVLATEPTAEQLIAGIDRFGKYGFYPTLMGYAGGDVTRLRQVLDTEANVFLLSLCVDTEKAQYQEKYHEVLSTRNSK